MASIKRTRQTDGRTERQIDRQTDSTLLLENSHPESGGLHPTMVILSETTVLHTGKPLIGENRYAATKGGSLFFFSAGHHHLLGDDCNLQHLHVSY